MAQPISLKLRVTRTGLRLCGWLAPTATAGLAYRWWIATHRMQESQEERDWRTRARLQFLQHEYGNIAVYHWGEDDKPVVVCVHGWNGHASQFASIIPKLLAAGYQVVAFDAPGHGGSDGTATNVFQIASVLQHVAMQFPTFEAIVSHSFGGMVSAYAVAHLGVQVKKLVMLASPVSARELLEMFGRYLGVSRRVMRYLDDRIRREFGDDIFERVDVEQNLKNSPLPILLVHDKQDKALSWQNSEVIRLAAANAIAVYTKGLGHLRPLRNQEVIQTIIDFIKQAKTVA